MKKNIILIKFNIQLNQIRRKVSSNFISQYHRYWRTARRAQSRFEERNRLFMKSNFEVKFKKVNLISECSKDTASNSNNKQSDSNPRSRGRPRKSFENSSRKTPKRRSKELQNKYSQEELTNVVVSPSNT